MSTTRVYRTKKIEAIKPLFFLFWAVRGGFEPPVRLPVRQFSKLVVSATHPPHLEGPAAFATTLRKAPFEIGNVVKPTAFPKSGCKGTAFF